MSTLAADAFAKHPLWEIAIEIVNLPGDRYSQLRLDWDGRIYDFVRVFSDRQSERSRQYLQHLLERDPAAGAIADLYLLVSERGYYSLWRQASDSHPSGNLPAPQINLLMRQQASAYLLQEMWVQWAELSGSQQLPIFARQLFDAAPQLQSRADLDRLLTLDPAATELLADWTEADWIGLNRQIYRLTQTKMGERFGSKLIAEIIDTLPEHLSPALADIFA